MDDVNTNFSHKVSQSGVIDLGFSDHSVIFCTRKTLKRKGHKFNKILVRSFKNWKIHSPECLKSICVNPAYSDFINRFMGAIDSVAPIKKLKVKANSKPWFDTQIISAIQKRGKLHASCKKSGLVTDKDNFKTSQIFLQTMLLWKKKAFIWKEN